MAALPSEKIYFGLALLVVAGSAAGFGTLVLRQEHADAIPLPSAQLSEEPYAPKAVAVAPVKVEAWAAPAPQSRGREWVYDAFSPPEIYYNSRSRQFSVKPPASLVEGDAAEPFGLELVAVRPEPFRLQLIGYVGGTGNWRGTFHNARTGEVFLAAAGRRLPALGLTIRSLDVGTQPVAVAESMTTRQRVASALVRDEQAGRDVLLTHRERVYTGTLFAFVAAPGESATREVRAGDSFKLGEATYRIEKIEATPPTVEVVKEAGSLSQPDRRILLPREPEAPEEGPPAPTS
ncbi:MAG: hypothetical protein ACO3G4_11750 [Opitutaceae bacterium]